MSSDSVDAKFAGPWFDSKTGAEYVGNSNARSFRVWCAKHFIVPRSQGIKRYAKADLDRAMKAKRRKPQIHPNTMANLRVRWTRGRDQQSA